MNTPYSSLLKQLLQVNLHGGVKLGLENSLRLNRLLGYPSDAFPSIHVAGTNGKGSVVTKIAAALQATGVRVGLYTSPHIASFRERIRINGEMIPEARVAKHLTHLFSLASSHDIPATFFELTTLMALTYFAEEKVDIAVIETGLGGRLDATNIVRTKLAIITSISLEHTEILGPSIEEITLEKAGIIKPFVPILIGPHVPHDIIQDVAKEKNSPYFTVDGNFSDFHAENEALARCALEILQVPPRAIEEGLKALPPCRLEIYSASQLPFKYSLLPQAVVLDVAHNPDGLKHLLEAISRRFPQKPLRFVIGLSKNKDIDSCLREISDKGSHFHLVEAATPRAAPKELLHSSLQDLGVPESKIRLESSISHAVAQAIQEAGQKSEIVIICGTFFIMQEARQTLGIQEPTDPEDLNEKH